MGKELLSFTSQEDYFKRYKIAHFDFKLAVGNDVVHEVDVSELGYFPLYTAIIRNDTSGIIYIMTDPDIQTNNLVEEMTGDMLDVSVLPHPSKPNTIRVVIDNDDSKELSGRVTVIVYLNSTEN